MKQILTTLILLLAVSAIAQNPIQRNRFTTNFDGVVITNAGFSNTTLSVTVETTSLSVSNVSTTNVPIQVFTNLNASLVGDNVMIQFGTLGTNNIASITLNIGGHAGSGDGSELAIKANRLAIVGTAGSGLGGVLQMGAQGATALWVLLHQAVGNSSVSTPYTTGSFSTYKYTWWNGSASVTLNTDIGVSRVNTTTGLGTLTTYDALNKAIDNSSYSNETPRFDIIGGIGIKGYGASIQDYISTTPSTTNYGVNMAMAAQDAYMSGPLNVSITNVTAITNTATGTASALVSDVFIYGGITSYPITFSNNPTVHITWESELGTEVSPTNIPGSNVMHVHLTLAVTGGITNCFANYKLGAYSPIVDPYASNFFVATSMTNALVKNAINAWCVTIRNGGLFATNKFIEKWFMAGDTGNGATNCAGLAAANSLPTGHNLTITGTVTNTANGMQGDGVSGFANTGLIPTNVFQSLNSGCVFVYNRSSTFVNSANGLVIGAADSSPSVYFGIIPYTAAGGGIGPAGLNAFSTADSFSAGSVVGFLAVNRTGASSQTMYANSSSSTSGGVTATGLGRNQSLYIFARNNAGTADKFNNCQVAGAGLFQNMTSGDMAVLQAAEVAFNTALGRQ